MSKESKTAKAAAKAVAKGAQVKEIRTTEKILFDVRNHLKSRLAVTPDDQRVLLVEYDRAQANIISLQVEVDKLKEQNEEFRRVYEAENSQASITVERISEYGIETFTKSKS